VIVPTPGLVDDVNRHGARHVDVVTGAVRDAAGSPDTRAAVRAELGIASDRRLFVYVGALGVANGLDLLLDAVGRLPQSSRASILLVGDGSARAALEERLRHLPATNVALLPAAQPARVQELLAAADVCLHLLAPSELFASALPNKLLDYFSAHRPFITTTPGLPETLARESGGGFAPTAAALAGELEHWSLLPEDELVRRGEAAYAYGISRFGFGQNADRLEGVLLRSAHPAR
jgi:glycosyltransferase involved in cell wall biosynthesis